MILTGKLVWQKYINFSTTVVYSITKIASNQTRESVLLWLFVAGEADWTTLCFLQLSTLLPLHFLQPILHCCCWSLGCSCCVADGAPHYSIILRQLSLICLTCSTHVEIAAAFRAASHLRRLQWFRWKSSSHKNKTVSLFQSPGLRRRGWWHCCRLYQTRICSYCCCCCRARCWFDCQLPTLSKPKRSL